MRYIIYGAGAVGALAGGRLFEHGHEVILIARGAHLEHIQQHGLTVQGPNIDMTLPVPAVSHPSEIEFRPDDVVLLAMKTQDTETALEALEATAGCAVPVLCMQNGVENERIAARRFPNTYGVYISMSSTFLEPGVVIMDGGPVSGILDVGCYPTGVDDTAMKAAAGLDSSMISSRPSEEVMRWKYNKLLGSVNNGVGIVCGEGNTRDLRRAVTQEGTAVLKAAGIDYASDEEMDQRRAGVDSVRSGGRSGNSTWQSIERGLSTVECDYFNGEIALLGRLSGVPTPYNDTVRQLAKKVARGQLKPRSLSADDVQRYAEAMGKE